MSVDDCARTSQALGEATMVASALESGALKRVPDGIDPQHVEFFQQHKADIDAMTQALEHGFGG